MMQIWYKKDTAESTQLYLFFLIVPKNHTTLKRWPHSAWTKSSFTTIKNYTTLKSGYDKIKHTFSKPFIDEYHRVHKLKIATTKQQWLTFKCILPSRITQSSNYIINRVCPAFVLLPLRMTQLSNGEFTLEEIRAVLLPLRITQLSNRILRLMCPFVVLLPLRITQLSNIQRLDLLNILK